jgi:hypothetical protein
VRDGDEVVVDVTPDRSGLTVGANRNSASPAMTHAAASSTAVP